MKSLYSFLSRVKSSSNVKLSTSIVTNPTENLLKKFILRTAGVVALFLFLGGSVKGQTTIWSENFDVTPTTWNVLGNFAVGAPGSSNVVTAPRSASKVLATVLNGDYSKNRSESNQYAISPVINCSGYSSITLNYYSYSIFETCCDYGRVYYSIDNGSTWLAFVEEVGSVQESSYTSHTLSLPSASNASQLKLKFTLNSDASIQYTGWNIDDLTITGYAPAISAPASLNSISSCLGFVSSSQSFNVSGSYMLSGITASAPTGYEVSTDNINFNSSVTIGTAGTIVSTAVYVRLNSSATGTPSGNIVLSSSGATSQNVAVSGTVIPSPTIVTVSSAGTYCSSTTLTASNGNDGTIYWQGTSSTGTSTGTPTTSQSVNASGTYYFRAQSGAGCWGPAGSAVVVINTPVAITVQPSTSSLSTCVGTAFAPLSITATGTSLAYQWQQSADGTSSWTNVASSGSSASYTPPNATAGTLYYRCIVSGASPCTSVTSDLSGSRIVNPLPAAVTVSTAGTYCSSTTLTGSNGNDGTIYWQGTSSTGTSTGTPSTSQSVNASGTYYFRAQSGAGCWGSAGSAVVVINTPVAITVQPSTSSLSTCAGTAFAPLSVTATGTSLTYQWQQSTDGVNSWASVASSGTSASYTPQNATAGTLYYRCIVAGASPCSSVTSDPSGSRIVNPLPAAVTVSTAGTYCSSTTLTGSNGNDGTIYWQGTSSTGTSTGTPTTSQSVNASGTYYFRAQSGAGCWGPVGSAVVVINTPVAITVQPSTSSLSTCVGTAFAPLSVTATGTSLAYQWQQSADGTSSWTNVASSGTSASYTPPNATAGTLYYRCIVSGASPCTSVTSEVSGSRVVNSVPTAPSVSIDTQNFCGSGGTTGITANGSVGTYSWTALEGSPTLSNSTGANINATVTATSAIQVVATYQGCSSTPTVASIGVYPLPSATMSTNALDNTVCNGGNVTINSGLTAGNFSSVSIAHAPRTAPAGATTLCAAGVGTPAPQGTSGTNYDDGGWANISIGFSFDFFGTNYSTLNVGTNGNVMFGTFNATSLADFTFTGLPSTSEPFNMVAILAMDNNLIGTDGGSVKYWTEGYAPNRRFVLSYQNVKEYGDTKYSTSQAIFYETTGVIEVHVTSSTNADRVKVVGVNNGAGTIGVQALAQTTAITTPVAYRFTPPANYTTQWYANSVAMGSSGTNVFSQTGLIPAANTTYSIDYTNQTTGCSNDPINASITVTVRPLFTAGEISSAGETICNAGTPSEIGSSTSASGGDNVITYSWRSSADNYASAISNATSSTYSPPASLTTTTSYRRYAKDGTCNTTPTVSAGTWTVTVRPAFTSGTISSSGETICSGGTPSEIGSSTSASGGDNVIIYSWRSSADNYSTAISSATSSTYTPPAGLTTTTSYRRYANDGTCNTTPLVSSGTWAVTVSPIPVAGTVSVNQTICSGNSPANITLTGSTGTIQWQQSATGTGSWSPVTTGTGGTSASYTPPALTSTTFYRARVTSAPCSNAFSSVVQVTVNQPSVAPISLSSTAFTLCNGGNTTLTQTGGFLGTNAVWQWYSDANFTSAVGSTISSADASLTVTPSATTTYYLRAVNGTAPCATAVPATSPSAVSVTVAVNQPSIAPTSISGTTTICNGASTTLTAVGGTLGTGGTYEWGTGSVIGTNPIAGSGASISVSPTSTTIYWVRIINGTSPCTATTDGTTALITVNPLASATFTGVPAGLNLCQGTEYTLTPTTNGGTWASSNTTLLGVTNVGVASIPVGITVGGQPAIITYTVVNSANGCSSSSQQTVYLRPIPSAPGLTTSQSFCDGATVGNLSASGATSGATLIWYNDNSNSNSYASSINLSNGNSYFASQTVNGCESTTRTQVVANVDADGTYRSRNTGYWSDATSWNYCADGATYTVSSNAPSNAAVIIQSGHTITGNSAIAASTLNVNATGSMILASPAVLTVSGTITNAGTLDILSGGQLLQTSDTDISGGGQCIFRKDLPLQPNSALAGYNRSYYIGSPVVGSTSTTPVNITSVLGSSTTGLNMYGYTESNNSWPLYYSGTEQISNSTFDIGKGYFVNSSSGTYFSQANFTGNSFNNGPVTVTLTNTAGQGGGYNLISNPYPSGINWSDIYNDASNTSLVSSSYWLRTYQDGAGMTYKTCNASGVSTQGLNTIISPATGFWVKYTGTSPGTFTFKNAMRTSGAGTYYTMNANRIIRLDLGNGTYDDQAVVYLNEDAGLGIESYDSDKRIPSTTVHQLYSLEGTTKLAINGFNNALAKDTVLLGMQIPTAGTYTINASQIDATIEEDIFLEDKVTGAYQNLKTTPSYSFTSTQGTFNNRFVLHFAPFVPALPGQTAATAIAMPTSNWPQCNNVSTEDQWHAFTATSEGISIEVNTASTDIVIELQDGTGNVVAQENAVNGIGNETLNFFGLTAGQTYKVGVRNNISSQPTGTYGICVKSLKRGGCDYGAGPYSLCQYYKATWAGSTGVSYTFTFTGTSGPAEGQTFTRTQNSDICVLSTVTPLLPYGSTYDVVISNTYTLTDGAGNTEQITVPSNSGCQVITIAQPQTTLSNSSSCNNGARFRGAVVSSMPWVCGANNWRWRFTEVNPLTMQEVGLPIELNRGTASNYLSLATVAQLQNGKTYAVQTAPMFTYTGTNYNWGPVQYMCIVGNTAMTLEGTDAAQGAEQGSTKDVAQDASQDLNAMVYVTEGNHVNIQLTNTASNTAKRADIYDVTGNLVKSVRLVEGMNVVTLTETAGIYLVRTSVGNQSETTRVFLNN